MRVKAIKTKKVIPGDKLFEILDQYLPKLHEKDVVIIASKIVAICQGRVVKNDGKVSKVDLMRRESQFYLPQYAMMYGIHLTITNNTFVVSAGVDESNGGGFFVLWPKDIQKTVNEIWHYLRKKNKIKHLGIVVSDSKLAPLRKGVTGMGLTWAGFKPLRSYVGKPDIFGRLMRLEKLNLVDSVATAAVIVMGEGSEQTPLGIVNQIPDVQFVNRIPTKEEIDDMTIDPKDDVFGGLIRGVKWRRGGAGRIDKPSK